MLPAPGSTSISRQLNVPYLMLQPQHAAAPEAEILPRGAVAWLQHVDVLDCEGCALQLKNSELIKLLVDTPPSTYIVSGQWDCGQEEGDGRWGLRADGVVVCTTKHSGPMFALKQEKWL